MSNVLVAYFSASGVTRGVAHKFEISPEKNYTDADLNWMDKNSRSSVEMNDKSFRPAINGKISKIEEYKTIYVGFPIWWYVAPTIINTFLESYDLTGKTIIPFATSGGSGMGNTVEELKPSAVGAKILEGKRFLSSVSEKELENWVKSLEI